MTITAQEINTNELPTLPPITKWELGDLPRIGEVWPGMGGRFVGIVRGQNGEPDYLLILSHESTDELNWQQAMDWAAGIQIEGHKDYTLPTREDWAVLFGNARDQIEKDGYWSSTQHAEYADYVWVQAFTNGLQGNLRKGNEWRARAVRRLIIQ